MSRFEELVHDMENPAKVLSKNELNFSSLRPSDALVLVAPTQPISGKQVRRFLGDGGTVLLFAEHGAHISFLEPLGWKVVPLPSPKVHDDVLAFAYASPSSPREFRSLSLVLNQPSLLLESTPKLGRNESWFRIRGRESEHARTVMGVHRFGTGALFLVSDASLITNRMLEARGNRALITLLLRKAVRQSRSPEPPRIWLTAPTTVFQGRYVPMHAQAGVDRFRRYVAELSLWRPDRILTGVLIVVLLLLTTLGFVFRAARSSSFRIAPTQKTFSVTSGRKAFGSAKRNVARFISWITPSPKSNL